MPYVNGSHQSSNVAKARRTVSIDDSMSLSPAVAQSSARTRLVVDPRVDVAGGIPEGGERAQTAGVVPDTCGHDAAGLRHPSHLTKPGDRVGHEVHHQLSQGTIKCLVVVGKVLGDAGADVDVG